MGRVIDGHADFVAAHERRRYAGSLKGLFVFLDFETRREPTGTDCWRVLKNGAVVSLKRKPNGKRILRIARSERPQTENGPKLWENEVATFLQHFGAPARWHRVNDDTAQGVAVCFHEEEPGVHCRCGGLIEPSLLPLATECSACAASAVRGKVGAP